VKICPKCRYHDPPYWRPRIFDAPSSIDITLLENFVGENPELAVSMKAHPGQTFLEALFAYKVTKGGMVWRKEREFWTTEGWSIPVDGAGTPKSARFKKDFLHEKTKKEVLAVG